MFEPANLSTTENICTNFCYFASKPDLLVGRFMLALYLHFINPTLETKTF